ncbi:MAG TPA: protease pro-enzyme activation domain-containing protein [Verrucomicrobiae bacterium]|nr:protease pro-enzyme activation domain-containing protein [Verrucomicrobiae bacterium]
MKRFLTPLHAAHWALALAMVAVFSPAAYAGPQILKDSIPPAVSHLPATGRLDPQTHLNLSIGLPLRNENGLNNLLAQLSDPTSPNYRHYLTPQQFTDQFAPSVLDYEAVANFFATNGFTVEQHPSRMVLDVSGPAADAERVFHVTMRTYQHPTEHRTFFAPDSVPSIEIGIPILHISGLDNYAVKRSKIVKEKAMKRLANVAGPAKNPQDLTGSGPLGAYMGNDFRAAYIPGVSLTGAGQTVGLLEFDSYYSSDITEYEGLIGTSVPLTNVLVDGGVNPPGAGVDEVSLDIEVAISIAPGLAQIVVYEAATNASWEDVLNAMANDTIDFPKQFSCSWGDDASGAPNTTAEDIFKQMDAQGQSFYNAAGDGDAFVGGIPFPEESTNIVQVGGTTVTTTGPGGPPIYETTWDWGGQAAIGGAYNSIGSGGGVSGNYSIPPWQQGISMTANEGSTTMRNTPDVAMTADNVYVVANADADNGAVGGTSAAAPAWAAITALANQQAAANGKPSVGFANPVIYAAGKSASYLADFNDITSGNNFWELSTTSFPAVPGYDLCTGWGTPAGDNLIDMLAGAGDAMGVAPGKGFVAFGPADGPFTANTLIFSLTNSSASSLNWSLINTSAWLTVSSLGGALAAHATTQVTVSLNAAAYSLAAGTYVGGVVFSNKTSQAVRTREFVIVAGQNLAQNGDFEDGGLSEDPDWAQSGGVGVYDEAPYPTYNYDFVDDGTVTSLITGVTQTAYSGNQFFVFGTAGAIGYISENIATVPGQTYGLSFWLMNYGGGSTTEFLANWNSKKIYDVLNSPDSGGWFNVTFYLTATGTNTILQFGARDDNGSGFIGLDDVILLAIPSLNPIVSKAGPNAVALTWNSVAGVQYDVQYSTNLISPNWTTLSTITAAGSTLSVTNSTASPQEFYRIAVP